MDEVKPDFAEANRQSGDRWLLAMRRGDFATAWLESDAIRRRGLPDTHRFWQGEAIVGRRLMLRSLHGYGDAVQMLRWVPRLAGMVEQLWVEVPPRFRELALCLDGLRAGNVEVLTWEDRQPVYTAQAEVMELPYLLRLGIEELPGRECYLRVPEDAERRVSERMGVWTRPRVGVVWSAGEWNETRSVPVRALDETLRECGAEVWSLQGERTNGQAAACFAAGTMRDGAGLGDGMLTLAATIANLDVVITVDTLAAHLAGAMGIPALVLLQADADWRWMVERADSPWYPSVHLMRCCDGEAWEAMLARVPEALATLLERGARCKT